MTGLFELAEGYGKDLVGGRRRRENMIRLVTIVLRVEVKKVEDGWEGAIERRRDGIHRVGRTERSREEEAEVVGCTPTRARWLLSHASFAGGTAK